MWVSNYAGAGDDKLYAYLLSGGARQPAKDITLPVFTTRPYDIWSDGTTKWVAEFIRTAPKLYAYAPDGGARQTGKDIALSAGNADPRGIWSNGTTMWVMDTVDNKAYAYRHYVNRTPLPSGTIPAQTVQLGQSGTVTLTSYFSDPDTDALTYSAASSDEAVVTASLAVGGSDVTLTPVASGTATVTVTAADPIGLTATQVFNVNVTRASVVVPPPAAVRPTNTDSQGTWSDGTTKWVLNRDEGKLYAYAVDGGARQLSKDITLGAGPGSVMGFWSDGTTM